MLRFLVWQKVLFWTFADWEYGICWIFFSLFFSIATTGTRICSRGPCENDLRPIRNLFRSPSLFPSGPKCWTKIEFIRIWKMNARESSFGTLFHFLFNVRGKRNKLALTDVGIIGRIEYISVVMNVFKEISRFHFFFFQKKISLFIEMSMRLPAIDTYIRHTIAMAAWCCYA